MRRLASRAAHPFGLVPLMLVAAIGAARAEPPGGEWGDACYVGFARHVAQLAGPDAVDCGLHSTQATRSHASARRCMRRALRAGRAYKVGVIDGAASPDACRVAVEGRSALPVYLWYFRDSPLAGSGTGRVWVQSCHDILMPDRPDDRRLFLTDDCVDAPALLPELFPGSATGAPTEPSATVRALPP